MKILILSSNLSNEAGGYAESSFLLRERLEKIKKNNVYLFGFWRSEALTLAYKLTDRINVFPNGFIEKISIFFIISEKDDFSKTTHN